MPTHSELLSDADPILRPAWVKGPTSGQQERWRRKNGGNGSVKYKRARNLLFNISTRIKPGLRWRHLFWVPVGVPQLASRWILRGFSQSPPRSRSLVRGRVSISHVSHPEHLELTEKCFAGMGEAASPSLLNRSSRYRTPNPPPMLLRWLSPPIIFPVDAGGGKRSKPLSSREGDVKEVGS